MDRDRLFEALKNADAAGDTAAATQIAAAIRSADETVSAPAQAAPERPAAQFFGGRPEDEGMAQALDIGAPALNKSLDEHARSFADFSSFGLANKGEAALDSMLNDKPYAENLSDEHLKSDSIGPLTKHVSGLLGLVASPVNSVFSTVAAKAIPYVGRGIAGTAARFGRYGMQGGLLNTLYGATLGNEENAAASGAATTGLGMVGMVAPPEGGGMPPAGPSTIASEIEKAVVNFGKGAAFGVGGPAVVEGAGPVARTLAAPALKRLFPEESFFTGLYRSGDRANLTPEMMAAKDAKLGPSGMLSNIGGQVTDYARDIAGFPGRARQAAQTGFARQSGSTLATQGGTVGRVEGAIDAGLSSEEARASTKALTELRTKTSSPLWEALPMSEAPQSKVFEVLAKNPEIKKGMRLGIAKERNLANADGLEFDPAGYAKRTTIREEGEGAYGPWSRESEGKAIPTFRAWQAGKEGVDDILFSGGDHIVDKLTGKLTGYGRSVAKMRGTLVEEMKLHMPGYEDALNTWSGPTQSMRMIELGQKVAKGDARMVDELMDTLTPNEQDFLRIGYADQMKYLATRTKDGANVVKSLFGDQNARRTAEMMFRSRKDFNQFRSELAREAKFHSSKQAVLGGSQTAPRLAGMEDAGADIGQVVAEGAIHGPTSAAANLASKGMKWLRSEPEAVRDVGAQYLFTTDPAKKAYALEQLRKIHESGNAFTSMPRPVSQNLLNFSPAINPF